MVLRFVRKLMMRKMFIKIIMVIMLKKHDEKDNIKINDISKNEKKAIDINDMRQL